MAEQENSGTVGLRVRAYPFPYKAMLAISTDIDRSTIQNFRNVHRFFSTREETEMGPGLGLDLGDSFWVYGSGLSLFSGYGLDNPGESHDELIEYIRCGWIDTLHSYGNFGAKTPFSRALAARALDFLDRAGLKIPVWTNHGGILNTQNFGNSRDPSQLGDLPDRPSYHLDLLRGYGTWLFWHPTRTFDLDTAIEPVTLADGVHRMWSFTRTQWAEYVGGDEAAGAGFGLQAMPGGRMTTWHPQFLPIQLAPRNLDQLCATGSSAVIGQHLGSHNPLRRFSPEAIAALRGLAERHERQEILVTRTSRLVEYEAMKNHVHFSVESSADRRVINVERIVDPVRGNLPVTSYEMVRGLTFELPAVENTVIAVNGRADEEMLVRGVDADGVPCVGVRWHAADHTDYAAAFAPPRRNGGAPSRDVAAEAVEILAELGDSGLVTDPEILSAIRTSSEEHSTGFAEAMAILEGVVGAGSRSRTAIIGGPIGPLGLAANLSETPADAIDAHEPTVKIARHLSKRLGLTKEITYSVDDPEQCALPENYYVQAICQTLFEYVDYEKILVEIKRIIGFSCSLYLVNESYGAHLARLSTALEKRDLAAARDAIEAMLSGTLYDAGIFHAPWRPVRCLSLPDVIGIGDAYGFLYNGRLGLVDRSFLGYPARFDVHFRQLGRRSITDFLKWIPAAQLLPLASRCVAAGAPAAAGRLLNASKIDRADAEFRICDIRASIKAGQARGSRLDAAEIRDIPHQDARIVAALLEFERGRFNAILTRLADDPGEAGFLRGMSYLALSNLAAARQVFDSRAGSESAALRDFIGLFATAAFGGDLASLRADFRRLVEWRRERWPAAAAECDEVLARLD